MVGAIGGEVGAVGDDAGAVEQGRSVLVLVVALVLGDMCAVKKV